MKSKFRLLLFLFLIACLALTPSQPVHGGDGPSQLGGVSIDFVGNHQMHLFIAVPDDCSGRLYRDGTFIGGYGPGYARYIDTGLPKGKEIVYTLAIRKDGNLIKTDTSTATTGEVRGVVELDTTLWGGTYTFVGRVTVKDATLEIFSATISNASEIPSIPPDIDEGLIHLEDGGSLIIYGGVTLDKVSITMDPGATGSLDIFNATFNFSFR